MHGKENQKKKKKRFSSPHSTDFLEEDDDDLDPFANWNNDVDDDDGLARDNCDVSPNRQLRIVSLQLLYIQAHQFLDLFHAHMRFDQIKGCLLLQDGNR